MKNNTRNYAVKYNSNNIVESNIPSFNNDNNNFDSYHIFNNLDGPHSENNNYTESLRPFRSVPRSNNEFDDSNFKSFDTSNLSDNKIKQCNRVNNFVENNKNAYRMNEYNNMPKINIEDNINIPNNFNGNIFDEYEAPNFEPSSLKRKFFEERFEQFTETSNKRSKDATDFSMILKVKIVDYSAPGPQMSKEQGFVLQNRLTDIMDEDILRGKGAPLFYGSGIINGVFKITCADQFALKWLHGAVDKLGQPWSNAQLRLMYRHEIPKFTTIALTIPGPSEDWSKVVMRLKAQNLPLKCHLWQFYERNKNQIYVGIDPDSLLYVEKMEKRLHYGLTKINCLIVQPK